MIGLFSPLTNFRLDGGVEFPQLLLEEGSEVDEEQAAAIKQFIKDIGGLENALAAVAMLDRLEEAA